MSEEKPKKQTITFNCDSEIRKRAVEAAKLTTGNFSFWIERAIEEKLARHEAIEQSYRSDE